MTITLIMIGVLIIVLGITEKRNPTIIRNGKAMKRGIKVEDAVKYSKITSAIMITCGIAMIIYGVISYIMGNDKYDLWALIGITTIMAIGIIITEEKFIPKDKK